MKTVLVLTLFATIMTVGFSTQLRSHNQQHQFLNLNSLNPLQLASLMSGDWPAILPASIQPFVRKLVGKEQQSGVAGFLNQAQNVLGGNGGGLLGGMGNLFGQASQTGQQSGLTGLLGNLGGSLGGNAASSFGLPSIPGLTTQTGQAGGLSGLVNGITGGLTGGANNAASGISGLFNGLVKHQ